MICATLVNSQTHRQTAFDQLIIISQPAVLITPELLCFGADLDLTATFCDLNYNKKGNNWTVYPTGGQTLHGAVSFRQKNSENTRAV